jgi:hypothetical protein
MPILLVSQSSSGSIPLHRADRKWFYPDGSDVPFTGKKNSMPNVFNRKIDWSFLVAGALFAVVACYFLWCGIMYGGMTIRSILPWWISGEQSITLGIIQALFGLWSFRLAFRRKKAEKP